jgi:TolB-like protein/DNA-binding winged helix-turn-helix (wHTH) protein/Tfp pilus assembly protein PilF
MGPEESGPASQGLTSYRFGEITLDPARRTVRRGTANIQLGKLTYELLLLLIEAAPRVVTQEEVAERLWNDRHVTQDTVRQRVKLLRKALSDDADDPRYINVVRGQGYRLIPDVAIIPTETTPPTWSQRPALVAGIALLVIATLFVTYWGVPGIHSSIDSPDDPAQSIPDERSIAVLPFENLVPGPDNVFFVAGIHNDLLTQLSKVSSLKIISRTSVLGYEDRKKNLRQIGDELNVATILEGSVQRSGDMLRINVQLIDAESDEHLWAERYDRELTAQNLFAIQSEIATSIAGALQAIISPEELARLNEVPTESTRAYNHYLLGNMHLRGVDNRTMFPDAVHAFQRAVDEDPEFALAWALLARSHSAVYLFVDHTESRRELARQAIDRAFELNPNLPEAHYAMGFYQYQCLNDTDAALQEWDLAAQGMPGDARIFLARSFVYRRVGDFEQAVTSQNRAINLDPRNIEQLLIQWHTYANIRQYSQAVSFADRIIEIAPDRPIGYYLRGFLPLWRDGDINSARSALESAPIEMSPQWLDWATTLYQRDYDAVVNFLDAWEIEVDDQQNYYAPITSYYGLAYQLSGMPDLAAQHLRRARATIEQELENKPNDPRLLIALGSVLGRQGQRDAAVDSIRRAIDLLSTSKDGTRWPALQMTAIFAFVAAGDYGTAIDELDTYLAAPAVWSIEGLLPDPRLDPIRNDRRFKGLVAKYSR